MTAENTNIKPKSSGSSFVAMTTGEVEMAQRGNDPVSAFQKEWPSRKKDPHYVEAWLQEQYVGEVEAVASMEALRKNLDGTKINRKHIAVVDRIIEDERNHVKIIGDLLSKRGVTPHAPSNPEILPSMEMWGKGCAVASRAEAIRAGQIRTVVTDSDTPSDIREVFATVLKEEAFHEKAFRSIAGEEEMKNHKEFFGWGTCKSMADGPNCGPHSKEV